MLFPGSRIWYEGAVGDLDSLSGELKTSRFSGHIVLELQGSPVVAVCLNGQFFKVYKKFADRYVPVRDHREILEQCRTGPGRMTVFELPPHLVQRLRGVHGRRTLFNGTATGGCDLLQILGELRSSGFSGILDADSPGAKLLLDFDAGVIVACYGVSFAGLSLDGLEAFRSWHEAFADAEAPTVFSIAERTDNGGAECWDAILMAGAERVPLPLLSSIERLAPRYGRTAIAGEVLFPAGSRPAAAYYVLSGELELLPGDDGTVAAARRLGPGQMVGISWLQDLAPARFAGRALVASSYLVFRREDLGTVFANSPALASRCVRAAAALLARMRTRREAFRAEPRLHDVAAEVAAALGRARPASPDGVPEDDIFRELAQVLPLPLADIDALFRKLVALGSISHVNGRVALTLREL